MNIAAVARELAEQAGPVLPLRGKIPLWKDWPARATRTPNGESEWNEATGVGLLTGARAGYFVLDVDAGNGGPATLAGLEEQNGTLPRTWTSCTGGGGTHHFFKWPDFEVRSSVGKLGAGVDVRGEGGQVVAPPSVHPNGTRYAWAPARGPGDVELAAAPAWLLERLRAPAPSPVRTSATPARSTDLVRRASAYLARIPGAISGSGGHAQTLLAAEHLVRGFQLDSGTALQLLLSEYNGRCVPPWSEKELRHKVTEADVKGTAVRRGQHLEAAAPARQPREPGEDDGEPPPPEGENPPGPGSHDAPPEPWPEPISLERRPELPLFPLEVLSPWMRRHVEAVAAATETDPAMTAVWDLTVQAIACAKRFMIERSAGRRLHANLWTLTLLGSGGGKSPTLRAAKEPLTAWEIRQASSLQLRIAGEATEERVMRRRLEWLHRQAAQAKEADARKAAKIEAEEIAGKLATWTRTVAPVLTVQSGTVARLQELLHEQHGRFALLSDEASAIEDLARFEQRNAPDLSSLNQAYDGDDLRIARKKRDDGSGGDRFVSRAVLSLGLSVQPGRALEQLRGARAFFDSGFMQRFLVVFPRDLLGRRTHEAPSLPEEVRAEHAAAMNELLELPPVDDGADFPLVELGADARQELKAWQQATEALWKPDSEDPLRGWGSKLGDKLVRLAGLFHAAEYRRMPWCTEITGETMKRALSTADYFLAHYKALLFDARIDPVSVLALKALAWFKDRRTVSFKKSDLYNGVAKWEGAGSGELLTGALKLLSETFHVRRTASVRSGGRTAEAYEVNPAVFR